MPTIDQLAPAAAASDSDELMISQNGVSRKISRGSLIAGLQSQIAIAPGTLLGNPGADTGQPSQIGIGANLTINGGTLSATATPYVVSSLPSGTVPIGGDMVPIGQSGANAAVTYSQFMSGLSAVTNADISKLIVTPTGSETSLKLGDLAATALLTTGAAMSGPLVLSGDPSQPTQAATKQYVDASSANFLPRSGGALSGPLTLTSGPTQPLQAATKAYVDAQAASLLPKGGGTLAGALTLAGDPAQPLDAATRRYVDAGDALSSSTIAVESQTRAAADSALQVSLVAAQSAASAAKANSSSALSSANTALTAANAAQAAATAALAGATTAQTLASAALPSTGGNITGNLSLSTSYVYAGNDDFAAVRVQGRPTDGKAMLYVNKVGSSGNDASLISSYYYVNDAGGTGSPRLVNNLQANVASTPVSGIWLTHLGITSSAVGGNLGLNGHLAADLQAIRDASTPVGNTTVQTALSAPSQTLSVVNLANFGQAPITGGVNAGKLTGLVNAAPLATVSTATASAGGTNAVIRLASTAGIVPGMFCWGSNIAGYISDVAANSVTLSAALPMALPSGSTVNAGWALLVKVGSRFYHLVSVSAASGPGTLVFAEPVASSDALTGSPVIVAQGGAPLWSFVAEIQDQTNLPSSGGGFAQVGELDLSGNGDDDGPNALVYNPTSGENLPQGGRCFLSFVGSKFKAAGPDFVMNAGLAFTTGVGASINSLILPDISFNAAVMDLRKSTASSTTANAIWFADGHRLAFSTDGKASISYDSSKAALSVTGQMRFAAPPVLPSYPVAGLPSAPSPGSKAYASDGRKPSEASGAGSGVEIFADNTGHWISILGGNQVQA